MVIWIDLWGCARWWWDTFDWAGKEEGGKGGGEGWRICSGNIRSDETRAIKVHQTDSLTSDIYIILDLMADIDTCQERINIHYPTPVVAEVKEEVSEDILDEIMEERMLQVRQSICWPLFCTFILVTRLWSLRWTNIEMYVWWWNMKPQVYTEMAEKKVRQMQVSYIKHRKNCECCPVSLLIFR